MPNRFKRVDEPDSNSVTVNIYENDDGIHADIAGPLKTGNMITQEIAGQDGSLTVPQALNMAITLAGKHKVQIVVRDGDGLWKKEWGELF